MTQHPLARTLVLARNWPILIDLAVGACGIALFLAILHVAAYWMGAPVPVAHISHAISALPAYAFYSMVRMGIAYLLSLVFAISYGYIAAYNSRVEAWLIGILDILQSIPVFSFLPPVVLAMVALVPGHQGRWLKPRASIATLPGSASGSLKCPTPQSAWSGTPSSRSLADGLP